MLDPLDDPEWHIFYAIRTGVRYTGMPAWNKALNEQDIWKVTGFLSRIDKLPQGAKDYWQKTFGVSPEPAPGEHQEHHSHDEHSGSARRASGRVHRRHARRHLHQG